MARALAEDLAPLGDLTSDLLPFGATASADFVARAEGVLAGTACATETFRQLDDEVKVAWSADDGEEVRAGEALGRVTGPLAPVLTGERTALNFLAHLSGVATLTRRFVRATHGKARVWDTRKTTPGLRALEKAAVRAGGGMNHRGNLSDWVLLKDNHLAALDIEEAVRTARLRWPARTVHVECERVEQVQQAVAAGADAVLLDNMSVAEVRECVAAIEGRCLVEVSGGITLTTVGQYAATGVDLISVGALTNSAPVLDIALDVQPGAP